MNTKDRTIFVSSSRRHYQSDLACEDLISNIAIFSNIWNILLTILSFPRISLICNHTFHACARATDTRNREARYRAFTLYRTACGSSSSSAIFREKKKSRGRDTTPSWAMSRTHVRARRTATAESEKRRARRTGARCGEAIRNVRRFESNRGKIGPGKLTTPAHRRRHRHDSLPLPLPANDSRVINRNGGESFSVEKYRIFRVCDAWYPVIMKFPLTDFFRRWYVRNREWHPLKMCRLFIDSLLLFCFINYWKLSRQKQLRNAPLSVSFSIENNYHS